MNASIVTWTGLDRTMMGAFSSDDELDWRRVDVSGIVTHGGIATVRESQREDCLGWLARERYDIVRIDCGAGFRELRKQLGQILSWHAQFGYDLDDGTEGPPNLNALRDGFGFADLRDRRVLCVEHAETVWSRDPQWAAGLLAIACEYSRIQLAVGRRFFTLVALDEGSPLMGAAFESLTIPYFGWNGAPSVPPAGKPRVAGGRAPSARR